MSNESAEPDYLCPSCDHQMPSYEYAIYLGGTSATHQRHVEEMDSEPENDNGPTLRGGEGFITPEESEFMIMLAQCFAGELKAAVRGAQEGFVKDDAIAAFLFGYQLGHKDGMKVARNRSI